MKAANLLISNDGSLRIADFGLARSYNKNVAKGQSGDGSHRGRERKYTNCVVTRWYRPPELLMGARHYGGEVDIWGIGYASFFFFFFFLFAFLFCLFVMLFRCVLGEMFTRKPILPGTSDLDQIEKIFFLCGAPNQHNWPNFDRLPGCEGVNKFDNHPRRLKPTYDVWVVVLWVPCAFY
jgi:serine/threonine-protein kinase BUR1